MNTEVAVWAEGVGVREQTDTDLVAARDHSSKVSNPDGEMAALAETTRRHEGLETTSAAIDRAFRIEVATRIDAGDVSFSRNTYDVNYLIPPEGWVAKHVDGRDSVEILSAEDVDHDERWVLYATPTTVRNMAQRLIDSEFYDSYREMAEVGLSRMLGHPPDSPEADKE